MQQKQTIRQNITWLAIANLLSKPLWFFFLLLSTRILGPEEFGKYMLAISYMLVAVGILEGGIDIHTIRTLPSNLGRFPRFFFHTTVLKIASCVLAGIGAYLFSLAVPSLVPDLVLFAAAVVFCLGMVTITHFRSVIRAFEIMKYEAWSIMTEKVSVMVLCGVALVAFPFALEFGMLFALSYVIASGVTLWIIVKKIGLPQPSWNGSYAYQEIIRPALPFATMNVFIILYVRSGTLLLAIMTQSDELVGYFNAGYRLVEAFILFPSMIIAPLYPVLARRTNDLEEVSRLAFEAMRIILVLATLISIPILLLHTDLTLLLYGGEYREAATTIGILGLVMIPVGLNWVVGTLVAVTGKQARANLYIFFITMVHIGALVLFIGWLGVEGAAIATLATECAITLANWSLVRQYFDWRKVKGLITKISVAVLGVFLLVLVLAELPLSARLPAALLGLVGTFSALRLITVDDFRRAFRESPALQAGDS